MRIGIDARCLEEKERTGVARYLLNLLRAFCELAPQNEYILYIKNDSLSDLPIKSCVEQRSLDRDGLAENIVFEQFILPRQAQKDGVDILFSPAYTTPLWCRCQRVVTIHDISYHLFPQWFKFDEILRVRTISRISAKRASKIFVVSEYTKREVVKHYGISAGKILVTHNGVDPRFKPSGDPQAIARVKQKYGIGELYILHVGAIFVRRNIPTLISAFREIANELPCQLVLVGPNRTNPYQDISALIKEKKLERQVVWIEYASDEDLSLLYEGAHLLTLLSAYEGFGFPAIEAMACGTPVVASNLTSLPEVVGDAGLLVDPSDVESVCNAIFRVLIDNKLRASLASKALERAKNFSWKKTAEKSLAAFEELVGRG